MSQVAQREARAWVLNLDVEHELRQPGGYTRSEAMLKRLRRVADTIIGLVGPEDIVLEVGAESESALGFVGDTWCPTPHALELLRVAGASVPAAPSVATLRKVNDRAFALALKVGSFGSRYVHDVEALREALGTGQGPWLLKRALSFAGRGHRRLLASLDEGDLRWCKNAFHGGLGIVVEALVSRTKDFGQHGFVTRAGEVHLGQPVVQVCDEHGSWQGATQEAKSGPGHLGGEERSLLIDAAQRAGAALAHASYFGPFGVDAFRYQREGRVHFNPLVELNARYTMCWALSDCRQERL